MATTLWNPVNTNVGLYNPTGNVGQQTPTFGQPKDDELAQYLPQPQGGPQYAPPPSTTSPTSWGQSGTSPGQALYTPPPPAGGGGQAGGGGADILDPNAAYGTPLPGTTLGPDALAKTGPAANETTTEGLQAQTRDALINILDQGMPTAQDPTLRPQISAFNEASNRGAQRQMNLAAEAFGGQGLESSGAQLAARQGILDTQGLNEGTFAANLVGQELTARRNQIMDALKVAQATTDQDLTRRLQRELANIDATIRNRGLDVQETLGQGDIDLRDKLGTGNLNVGLLDILFRDRQHGDNTSLNIAQLEAAMNNAAVAAILGGR